MTFIAYDILVFIKELYHLACMDQEVTKLMQRGCLSALTLSILTLSKVSFLAILRNDYLNHFDTLGENFDFDTFKNNTFENDTFESV